MKPVQPKSIASQELRVQSADQIKGSMTNVRWAIPTKRKFSEEILAKRALFAKRNSFRFFIKGDSLLSAQNASSIKWKALKFSSDPQKVSKIKASPKNINRKTSLTQLIKNSNLQNNSLPTSQESQALVTQVNHQTPSRKREKSLSELIEKSNNQNTPPTAQSQLVQTNYQTSARKKLAVSEGNLPEAKNLESRKQLFKNSSLPNLQKPINPTHSPSPERKKLAVSFDDFLKIKKMEEESNEKLRVKEIEEQRAELTDKDILSLSTHSPERQKKSPNKEEKPKGIISRIFSNSQLGTNSKHSGK